MKLFILAIALISCACMTTEEARRYQENYYQSQRNQPVPKKDTVCNTYYYNGTATTTCTEQ